MTEVKTKRSKWKKSLLAGVLSLAMVLTSLQFSGARTMVYADSTEEIIDSETTTLQDGKTYKLENEKLSVASMITVPAGETATLDLNGNVLILADGNCGILVEGDLTITDSNSTKINYFEPDTRPTEKDSVAWELKEDGGTKVVNGGVITGANLICSEEGGYFGGAIRVSGSGTLIMNGGNIVGNKVTASDYRKGNPYGGAAVGIETGATFTMNGGTIQGNATYKSGDYKYGYGGAIWNAGTVTVEQDAVIAYNEAYSGGGVYNLEDATFTNKGKIDNNWAGYGGGVRNKGTFTNNENATINSNNAYDDGGGVNNDGTFTNNGDINSNVGNEYGGGVYNEGSFNNAGNINENLITKYGGGAYNYNGTLSNSGEINNNKAENTNANGESYGGGVYTTGGTMTNTESGEINQNSVKAYNALGGGIYGSNSDRTNTVVDNYGQINENTVEGTDTCYKIYGGGICLNGNKMFADRKSFTVTNYSTGHIEGNTATGSNVSYGGGVYSFTSTFKNYGLIKTNTATCGGGIYTTENITVGGSCQITDNKDTSDKNNNVAIDGYSTKIFIDSSNILSGGTKIGVNKCSVSGQNVTFQKGVVVHNYKSVMSDENANTYFDSDCDNYCLKLNDSGHVEIVGMLEAATTAQSYDAAYDGASHGITVTCTAEGAEIKYGTGYGTYDLTESPKYKDANASSYTVYYQVTKTGSDEVVVGQQTIRITKRNIDTVTGLKANNKKVGSTTDATFDLSEVILEGVIAGDDVQLDVEGSFAGTDSLGEKTINITKWALKGTDAGNYNLLESSKPLELKAGVEAGTVTFNTNGAGSIDPQSIETAGAYITKPTEPTKQGYIFGGWYSDAKYTKAWNFDLDTVCGDVTLYAKWFPEKSADNLFTITGIVYKNYSWAPDDNARVELKRGIEVLKTTKSDASGEYTFYNVEGGEYNIVVTTKDQARTNIQKVVVDESKTVELKLAGYAYSSVVNIEEVTEAEETASAIKTNRIIVSGLDEEAGAIGSAVANDYKVKVQMTVTQQNENGATGEVLVAINGIRGITEANAAQRIEHLDISVIKKDASNPPVRITNTTSLIEIIIPFDFTNKKNVRLFRYHNDGLTEEASALVEIDSREEKGDGKYYLDRENNCIDLYAQKFSLYSVGYDLISGGSGSSSGGGSYTPSGSSTGTGKTDKSDAKIDEKPVDPEQEAAEHKAAVAEDIGKKVSPATATEIRKSVPVSDFSELQPVVKKNTKTEVTLGWKAETDADGYMIYGNKCNTSKQKYKLKLLKTVGADELSAVIKSLEKGTYYKYQIVAYKLVDGKRVAITKTPVMHTVTKGGKYGVAKAVRIDKIGSKKIASEDKVEFTLEKGKKARIIASEIKENKPIKQHRELVFETSDKKVATVSKTGKITAKKKGSCVIYVYAQNGIYNEITVTVK